MLRRVNAYILKHFKILAALEYIAFYLLKFRHFFVRTGLLFAEFGHIFKLVFEQLAVLRVVFVLCGHGGPWPYSHKSSDCQIREV